MAAKPVPPFWHQLLGWRFWLNFVVILVASCWISLYKAEVTLTSKTTNTVVQKQSVSVPLYQSYKIAVTKQDSGHIKAIAMQWIVVLVTLACVWWIVWRMQGGGEEREGEQGEGEQGEGELREGERPREPNSRHDATHE